MSWRHTPGPWEFDEDKRGRKRVFAGGLEIVRALASHGTRRLSRAEREANAHLIAAAPAMLEALKRARPYVADAVEKLKHTNEPVPARDLEKVDRALRLAELGADDATP